MNLWGERIEKLQKIFFTKGNNENKE
jgi:hypothetical protein